MKKEEKTTLQEISRRLRAILKAHKGGEPVIRDMAQRIAARRRERGQA